MSEKAPLAPAGQLRWSVLRVKPVPLVGLYSKWLTAGPLLAVPRAFRRAESCWMSVAGSVLP